MQSLSLDSRCICSLGSCRGRLWGRMIDVPDVQRCSFQLSKTCTTINECRQKPNRYESLLAINHRMLSCRTLYVCVVVKRLRVGRQTGAKRRCSLRCCCCCRRLLLLRFPRNDQALKTVYKILIFMAAQSSNIRFFFCFSFMTIASVGRICLFEVPVSGSTFYCFLFCFLIP